MSELLTAISDFDKSCQDAETRYVIGGSVCSGIHSIIRNTNDVDIVLGRALTRRDPLLTFLEEKFIVDPIGLEQSHLHGKCFNIFHEATAIKFDLFPPTGEFQRMQLARGVTVKPASSPRSFQIASLEDIIIAKLKWLQQSGSERQAHDIQTLLSVNAQKVDFAYVDAWAKQLALTDLLQNLKSTCDQ